MIPVAEADHGTDKIYSVSTQDQKNGIALIADGEAPVIRGMEILENRALIDRRDGAVTIRVTATDALSGVDHFTIVISNTDNAVSKTYLPGEDGCIVITITERGFYGTGICFGSCGEWEPYLLRYDGICTGKQCETYFGAAGAGLQMRRKRNSYLYHMGICGPGGSHFPGMYDSTGSDIE